MADKNHRFNTETIKADLWGFEPQYPAPKAGRISRLPHRPKHIKQVNIRTSIKHNLV